MTARERAFYEFGRDAFEMLDGWLSSDVRISREEMLKAATDAGLFTARTDRHKCPAESGNYVRPSFKEPCGCLVPTYSTKEVQS